MLGLILLTTIFSLIVSIIVYSVGYYGGGSFVIKYYNRSKKFKKSVDFCERIFTNYGAISTFVGRLIPFSRTSISLLAGVYKQKFLSYLISSLFGIVLWNSLFIYLGFSLVINLEYVSYVYDKFKILILIIFSVSIIMLFWWKCRSKKR